eukprot:10198799-Lingulodinium_polyedra.AAC.1
MRTFRCVVPGQHLAPAAPSRARHRCSRACSPRPTRSRRSSRRLLRMQSPSLSAQGNAAARRNPQRARPEAPLKRRPRPRPEQQ